jgi:hypothetical protein
VEKHIGNPMLVAMDGSVVNLKHSGEAKNSEAWASKSGGQELKHRVKTVFWKRCLLYSTFHSILGKK